MFPVDTKILVVDDSSFARTMVKNALRELKFWRIMEGEDAGVAKKQLLEAVQEKAPVQLMICDVHMPNQTGLELVEWLRTQEAFRGLPVIMLTSSQNKDEVLAAAKLDVSQYVIKPFNPASFRERIETSWEKHGQKYMKWLEGWKVAT